MYAFFFNETATTEIYTLSLHDDLPIYFVRSLIEDKKIPSDVNIQVLTQSRNELIEKIGRAV